MLNRFGRAQSGSMLLFVAVAILPAILLLFALTLGTNTLLHEREHAKQVADSMALFGARSLPMAAQAKRSAEEYFGNPQKPDVKSFVSDHIRDRFNVNVTATPGEVQVTLTRKTNYITLHSPLSTLDKIFSESPIELSYSVQSIAQRNPRNILIFMDDSDYLAPPITEGSGSGTVALKGAEAYKAAWGQIDQVEKNCPTWYQCGPNNPDCKGTCIWEAWLKAQDLDARGMFWPASNFPSTAQGTARFYKWKKNGDNNLYLDKNDLNPLLATQQCYNPSFSALKDATIRMYDYLSSIPQNLVSVMVGPEFLKDSVRSKGVRVLNAWGSNMALGVDGYNGEGISDEYCMALAEDNSVLNAGGAKCVNVNPLTILDEHADESLIHCGYGVPRYSDQLGIEQTPRRNVFYQNGRWQMAGTHHIPVREAIWGRAVARRFRNHEVRERKLALNHALTAAASWLFAAPLRENRAAAALEPSYSLFFMLGDLPWTASEGGTPVRLVNNDGTLDNTSWARLAASLNHTASLAWSLKAKLNVYIVVFKHEGNYPPREPKESMPNGQDCSDQGPFDDLQICAAYLRDVDTLQEKFNHYMTHGLNQEYVPYFNLTLIRVPDRSSLPQDAVKQFPFFEESIGLVR